MLSVTLGADGWTTFGPSGDTQVWYVSNSSGSDTNPGTEASPFKSLAKAKSMLRDGKPDWMLLKRGDTWNEVFGSWVRSGRSADEMMLIGTYGTGDRPLVRTNGLDADGITLSGGTSVPLRYLAIQGISFHDNTHGGEEDKYGIRLQRTGTNFYIEDVKIQNFKDGIVIGMEPPNPGVSNITIRRSVIVDQWQKKSGGHSQGLYASGSTNGLLIEENVFDHNGWKEGVAGAEKTVFNHNMYINDGAQNVVIRNNISTRASLRGILSRGGGVITGNVTARNAQGVEAWGNSVIDNNVVLENGDIPDYPQGFGIQVLENNGDSTITNNIVAHDESNYTYNVFGIRVWYGMNSATVRDNIVYDWRRPFWYHDTSSNADLLTEDNELQIDDGFHGVVVHRGAQAATNYDYENNTYYSPRSDPFYYGSNWKTFPQYRNDLADLTSTFQRKTYLDPNRELSAYNAFLGGPRSFDAFINNARNMSRTSYDPNYTTAPVIAYIREGFGLGSGVGTQVYVLPSDVTAAEPNSQNPNPDPGTFTIFRTGPLSEAVTFNYTIAGNATYGTDYTTTVPQTGSITIPVGVLAVDVVITPVADINPEDPETVDFRILSGSGYDPGAPANATINIIDGNGGTLPPTYPPPNPDDGGGWIPYPVNPVGAGTGLKGEYFDTPNFSGNPVTVRLDPQINYNYQMGGPLNVPVEPDTFSIRWSGYIMSDQSGTHEFRVNADDGVRLYVDDRLIIDTLTPAQYAGDANGDGFIDIGDFAILAANFNQSPKSFADGDFDGNQIVDIGDFAILASRFNTPVPPPPPGSDTGTIHLERFFRADIRLEYVENVGNASVQLFWRKAQSPEEELIPTGNLFPPDGFNGGTPARPAGGTESTAVAALSSPATKTAPFSSDPIGDDVLDDVVA